ncbi:hypothetical protein [Streptomyces sp. SAI-090]|jgi:hypothetical protein|uniref:hypothetical protein n=1 Tax=Streptomyces sp. SAI-090 TaxID=2940545 RepID=UPI002475988E|nr:hypothetical protein [Streptomyces sp. SAI-090]MDH6522412.1 hypothetical protein [Streptomyces sp. SAI-090]
MRSEVPVGQAGRPAVAQPLARGVLWSVLAMSCAGTVVTAAYLPAPWGRLVVVPGALGALIAAAGALFHIAVGVTGCLTAVGGAARRSVRGSDQPAGPDVVEKT